MWIASEYKETNQRNHEKYIKKKKLDRRNLQNLKS